LSLVSSTEEAVGSIPMAAEAIGIQEVIGNNPKKMINRRTPEALVIFSRPAN
jgi:hypothetical protein